MQGDDYKDKEPDAVDLFKICHYSKKKIRNRRSSLQNVQAQLEVERRTNVELQSIVNNQREAMNDLLKQMQETEQARIKDQEENRKKQAVLEAKLELLLGQNRQS